jgi:3-hydroxyisobutyrate dehydrogenase
MDVGFIGLGVMGLPMAGHLVTAGHTVRVASRSRGPVERAVQLGAIDGGDAVGVVRDSELTVVCVPDSPDVISVVDAILPALGSGKVVVDCSTIDPAVERAQHERVSATGARYLEAPVSGGSAGAIAGTLTLMCGGDAALTDELRPVLDAFSGLVVHVGGPGLGQVVKICNNVIYAASMVATAEAFALAAKSGADLAKAWEVITHSSGDCVAVRTRVPYPGVAPGSPADNGWAPGFMTDLMAKDVDITLRAAAAAGVPMWSGAMARQMLVLAQQAGFGREDFSALGKVTRSLAGEA